MKTIQPPLKFKGLTVNTKKWICGRISGEIPDNDITLLTTDDGVVGVQSKTLRQFTGYLDSGGKEIYFGDSVRAIAKIEYERYSGKYTVEYNTENDTFTANIGGLPIKWGGWILLNILKEY